MTSPSTPAGSSESLRTARLGELLRAAMPPTGDEMARRDLWPAIVERIERPARWSMLDLGLAAAVVLMLSMFPEWVWPIAYHL